MSFAVSQREGIEALRDDAACGKIQAGKLIDVIAAQQKCIDEQQRRIDELETLLKSKNPTNWLNASYSERAEPNRKQEGKSRKRKLLRRSRSFKN